MSAAVLTRRAAAGVLPFVGGALFTLLLTLALWSKEPSAKLAVAGGVGLFAVTVLTLWSENAAVALAAFLLAAVRVEPAPTDAVFLVVIAFASASGRVRLLRAPAPVVFFLGSYLALNLVAATQAVAFTHAMKFAFTTFYLALLALWVTGWLDSRTRARIIVRAYIAGAVMSSLLGVGALFGGPGHSILVYQDSRAMALFKDPNVLGSFLVPAALILAEELLRPSLLRSRARTKVVMFLIVAIGVVFSFSRASIGSLLLGLVVIAVVYGLRRGGGRRAMQLLVSMALAGTAALGVLSATGKLTFLQSRSKVQGYDSQRFGAQDFAIRLATHHPFGVGPGQFEQYSPVSAHETYLRALAEIGVLGVALVAALLLTTLIYALRNAARGIDSYGVGSATLLGAWLGFVGSGFVIDTLHWRHLWVTAAFIWAGAARNGSP